jgi:hypothetical protein
MLGGCNFLHHAEIYFFQLMHQFFQNIKQ